MSRFDIPCNGKDKSQIYILGNMILIVGFATNYIDIFCVFELKNIAYWTHHLYNVLSHDSNKTSIIP